MLEKAITYTGFDGEEVTETFYFSLNLAEIAEKEMAVEGGWGEYLKKIVQDKDGKAIIEAFKELISASVGKREGNRFIKSPEITNDFMTSEAYSEFFVTLVTDANAGVEFVNAIMPAKMRDKVANLVAAKTTVAPTTQAALPQAAEPLKEKTVYDYTPAQLLEIPQHEFDRLAGKDPTKMPREVLNAAFLRRMKN